MDSVNFSCQNLDYIWHNYRESWLITIEEKRWNGSSTFAQRDTHSIVSQMLAFASMNKFKTARGVRPVDYRGHYVISFENTTPDDSTWCEINGRRCDDPAIVIEELLRTGRIS